MRARRVDANHFSIAEAFRRSGCLVHNTISEWDLTVSKFNVIALVEVKDPKSPNLKRRNKGNAMLDAGWPIFRVMTVDDVITVCDKLRRDAMVRDGIS